MLNGAVFSENVSRLTDFAQRSGATHSWFSQDRDTLNANASKRAKGANFLIAFAKFATFAQFALKLRHTMFNSSSDNEKAIATHFSPRSG
jgi:hypothetical protein